MTKAYRCTAPTGSGPFFISSTNSVRCAQSSSQSPANCQNELSVLSKIAGEIRTFILTVADSSTVWFCSVRHRVFWMTLSFAPFFAATAWVKGCLAISLTFAVADLPPISYSAAAATSHHFKCEKLSAMNCWRHSSLDTSEVARS